MITLFAARTFGGLGGFGVGKKRLFCSALALLTLECQSGIGEIGAGVDGVKASPADRLLAVALAANHASRQRTVSCLAIPSILGEADLF
jgi:hypothetical protein